MNKLPKFAEERLLAEKLKTLPSLIAYEKFATGETIRKLRKRQKIKQSTLAVRLGTSQSTIARIEAGKQNLTIETLTTIAYRLGKKLTIKFQ